MRVRLLAFVALIFTVASIAADTDTLQPKELAAQLRAKGPKPAIFYVGWPVMFRKHIPGAVAVGATASPDALNALKTAAARIPHTRSVIIYCGCCRWDECPNVKPAVDLLKQMGFQHVKALVISENFAADWIDHGYAVEQQANRPTEPRP